MVFAVGLVFILLIIALIVYFWYIILPAIVVIVVIYILRNRKPRIKKTSSGWETLPKEEPSEDSRQTNHRQTYKSKYTRSVEKLEKLQNAMLKKFNLAEFEAKLVFGEKWKNILAKKNTQDEKLVNSILKIQTKVMFDLDYREKVIRIADKLIQMIDSVISDNPEKYEKYTNDMGQYEKIYKHQWKFFKKHKKTAFEEVENELGFDGEVFNHYNVIFNTELSSTGFADPSDNDNIINHAKNNQPVAHTSDNWYEESGHLFSANNSSSAATKRSLWADSAYMPSEDMSNVQLQQGGMGAFYFQHDCDAEDGSPRTVANAMRFANVYPSDHTGALMVDGWVGMPPGNTWNESHGT